VEQVGRIINHRVRELFPDDAVVRAELLRDGDHPGQLTVRVFIPAAEDPAAWAAVHRERMAELRGELSLRLPSARMLEFTSDAPGAAVISVPDDGSLAAQQPASRDIAARALALLRENYVFPELAEQVATAVEARLAAGEYDNLDEITLTELLTTHLQEASGDRHLQVRLGGGPGPGRPGPGPGPGRVAVGPGTVAVGPGTVAVGPNDDEPADHEAMRLKMRQMGRLDNFGIRRTERLDGNVGYLDLRRIALPENAGPAIAAAMELVSGTYALIIDLRGNGGGSPDGVAVWCSYLLPEQPAHLNDIFHADTGETRQFWSLPYLPGTRYLSRPVYAHVLRRRGPLLHVAGPGPRRGDRRDDGRRRPSHQAVPGQRRRAHRHPVRALGQPGDRDELAGHRGDPGYPGARGRGVPRRLRQGAAARHRATRRPAAGCRRGARGA
jgi:hypothetical protein